MDGLALQRVPVEDRAAENGKQPMSREESL